MEEWIKELMLMGSSAVSVERFLDPYETSDAHYIAAFPEYDPNVVIAYRKEEEIIEILDAATQFLGAKDLA